MIDLILLLLLQDVEGECQVRALQCDPVALNTDTTAPVASRSGIISCAFGRIGSTNDDIDIRPEQWSRATNQSTLEPSDDGM